MNEPTLAFENAPESEIEIGDIVLTVWGWAGRVYRISNGRYSLAVQYKMPRGYFTPDHTPRHYVHGYEIAQVIS